ncbi:cobalamin biosynthesis protein CobG [Cognatishimia sp. SS12]|uniref:cobalamin biosynthesis protein CobG n=1 Tax=Cognatishimia sp. SS12 TaxID=2979465 RepID=UPI00232D5F9F|nr:cobalamin biosynthesis protein CobG [Cognatishimia sp. SS12]MDC0736674.1 cobalamin biosynthesis protein CobG [Cognatishimia sp. SS12]
MSRPTAKGWCPGAYQPMLSGDGLVVRIRPILARLTRAQALGLCGLAQRYGSGIIDVTSRANIQLRGVDAAQHDTLLTALVDLDLLPDDPAIEARRNILVAPDWPEGGLTERLARQLITRLTDLPALPAKFGFSIEADAAPMLGDASADLRIERAGSGLILRAEGCATGRAVTEANAIDQLIALAHWFAGSGGQDAKRMARHLTTTELPPEWQGDAPLKPRAPLAAGLSPGGTAYGVAFGQINAAALADLIEKSACRALRVTPWRLIVTEDAAPLADPPPGLLTQESDPLRRLHACPGAPFCASATVQTHALARRMAQAPQLPGGRLHISGCAKGCAHPRRAGTTLVGHDGRFDLVRDGLPWDDPDDRGLTDTEILTRLSETGAL